MINRGGRDETPSRVVPNVQAFLVSRPAMHILSHLDRGSRREVYFEPPRLSKSAFEVADAAAL